MGEVPGGTFAARAGGRLPQLAAVTLGIVASVVGLVLATRPPRSLAVLVIVVVLALTVSGVVDVPRT
ncbi:MAG TPA: hypothetical protein VJN29_03095 [Intrasporangium sp.]|uniref:hypothetical protein n=1 Tax=Intrasporangium sp. TaxID=1925024 RepID=UPI002B46DE5F|nr:hypothetical protein [Intrasporangium sp.]HKX66187.1 hypothetical protein [Intrasporangium sp.]